MTLNEAISKIWDESVLWGWVHPRIPSLFFRVLRRDVSRTNQDGSAASGMTFYAFDRGSSVAALLHEIDTDTVILIRQYRAGVNKIEIEIPAGMLEINEDPEVAVMREVFEETGYGSFVSLKKMFSLSMSPGGSTEISHSFYIRVKSTDKTGEGGGLLSENEFLDVLRLPASEAILMIHSQGRKNPLITDAKTVAALLWLENQRLSK